MSAERPLSGRTALITGGSRGIGAASARALAALGATVVVTYHRDRAAAEKVAVGIREQHAVPVHLVTFNLTAAETAPEGADALLEAVARVVDSVDILVANAAAPYPKVPLLELSARQLSGKLGHDIGSVHRLVTAVAPGMLDRGYGRIMLIGSLQADGPSAPGMAANGVSKAALAAYVAYAVDELTGPGVTVNLIHPGYIGTEASSHLPPAIPAMIAGLTPVGRTGTPDDVAGVVAMLARDEASFLNGARLPVSGGLNSPISYRRLQSLKEPTL
ncbi:SDR family oxidoreductase [Nocardia pneumoniae]|uniref:SDR family oxidoreductase n=1 Tax=Nocardia pneumoniae TaxID=228601 RepID=UPI0002D26BFB|nr:SDR family oxidoreductase [Nocardia pneumoniae]